MVLSLIGAHCTDIESIGLGGWQGLHYEHLKSLLQDCPRLGKLDLSDVSVSIEQLIVVVHSFHFFLLNKTNLKKIFKYYVSI